jgi:hypothetical protein
MCNFHRKIIKSKTSNFPATAYDARVKCANFHPKLYRTVNDSPESHFLLLLHSCSAMQFSFHIVQPVLLADRVAGSTL